MLNLNVLLFVGIAIFAIMTIAPVVVPLFSSFAGTIDFMPRRY